MTTLEFDLGQKWAKGARISFLNQEQSANFDFKSGDYLKQVRGKNVVTWKPNGKFESVEADGLIAHKEFKNSKRKLILKTADCAPLFYVDRESECLAAIHAGWQGLALGIHKVPFERGLDPKTTWIWCGPCLNGKSFEVGEDMWSQFPKDDLNNYFEPAPNQKKYFNMWNFLDGHYKKLGVELFYNVEIDTFTSNEYNSNRRWKKSGDANPLQHNYSWIGFFNHTSVTSSDNNL